MDKQPTAKPAKSNLLTAFARQFGGRQLAGVVLSALSAWMIVTGLKGLAGFEVNQQTAIADLLGIAILIGVARWIKSKYNVK